EFYIDKAQHLAKLGVAGFGFELPESQQDDSIDLYHDIISNILFSEQSPLYLIEQCLQVPRYDILHSIASAIYLTQIAKSAAVYKQLHRIEGAFHIATFLETAKSSNSFSPIVSNIFDYYASNIGDKKFTETFLGKVFQRVTQNGGF